MRRLVAIAAGSLAVVAGCGDTPRAERAAKPAKPALEVVPRSGPPGTVFEVRGRGWRAGEPVEAQFGPYCPGSVCEAIAHAKRFRADAEGRFVFRFREGSSARGLPEPAAAGSALVMFEQWTGRPYRSKLTRVRPRYSVK